MTICYFGNYDPDFSRNRIYIRALRELGHSVVECRDLSPGLRKWWRLARSLRSLDGAYDALVVGYPGHSVVPLARLLSRKKVVADLLGSLSDAGVHSHRHNAWHRLKNRVVDWLAVSCAHVVLLETEAQRRYFENRFGHEQKYRVLYTGVDESEFFCREGDGSDSRPAVVVFRGRLTFESGILHILRAAASLKDDSRVRFRIIGYGRMSDETRRFIKEHGLVNVEHVHEKVPFSRLRALMCGAAAGLGQFEDNPRLSRTIPHKIFESMVMGLPIITGESAAVRELLTDGTSCLFVPVADGPAIAQAVTRIASDAALRKRLAAAARDIYYEKVSNDSLGRTLVSILRDEA